MSPATEDHVDADTSPWILRWTVIFAVNLAVPTLLASSLIEGTGAFGIVAGMLFLLGGSIAVQLQFPHMVKWAQHAGVVVAVSQFLPILHIVAGDIGIGVATSLRLLSERSADDMDRMVYPPMYFAAALVATIVTGAILLLAVAVLSVLLKLVFGGGSDTRQ